MDCARSAYGVAATHQSGARRPRSSKLDGGDMRINVVPMSVSVLSVAFPPSHTSQRARRGCNRYQRSPSISQIGMKYAPGLFPTIHSPMPPSVQWLKSCLKRGRRENGVSMERHGDGTSTKSPKHHRALATEMAECSNIPAIDGVGSHPRRVTPLDDGDTNCQGRFGR
jgi:hypothetical protein